MDECFKIFLDVDVDDLGPYNEGSYPRDVIALLALRLVRVSLSTGCGVRTHVNGEKVIVEPSEEDLSVLTDELEKILNP